MLSRKNWLFSDSVKGAESIAIVYPLVETAKANGVKPYEVVSSIFRKMVCRLWHE